MKKKIILILLMICFTFSFNNIAFAADAPITSINEMSPKVVEGNDIYSQKDYVYDTKYEGIKQSVDGYYAMTIETKDGEKLYPSAKLISILQTLTKLQPPLTIDL